MKDLFTYKKVLQYYLPVSLTCFMLVTIQRTVITDGGNDRLYGLPLPWITSSYASSFRYDVFIIPMLVNLFVFFLFTSIIFWLLGKMGLSLKTNTFFMIAGIAICLFWILEWYLLVNESSFYSLSNLPYTITSQKLKLGSWP